MGRNFVRSKRLTARQAPDRYLSFNMSVLVVTYVCKKQKVRKLAPWRRCCPRNFAGYLTDHRWEPSSWMILIHPIQSSRQETFWHYPHVALTYVHHIRDMTLIFYVPTLILIHLYRRLLQHFRTIVLRISHNRPICCSSRFIECCGLSWIELSKGGAYDVRFDVFLREMRGNNR